MHLTLESEKQYFLAAIYDGIPGDPNNPRGTHIQFNSGDGLFGALEWGWTPAAGDKIALGAWQHSAEVESVVTGNLIDSNSGVYLIAEKNINDIAAVFLQLGRADDQFNQLEYYAGTGVPLLISGAPEMVWASPLPKRAMAIHILLPIQNYSVQKPRGS